MNKTNSLKYLCWKALLMSICFLLCTDMYAQGGKPEVEEIEENLDIYLLRSSNYNPKLRARFNGYLTSLQRISQVKALPDPEITFGRYILPIETRNGTLTYTFSVGQAFPYFGTLGTLKEIESSIAESKLYEYSSTKTELFFDVKKRWYKLYELKKEIEINEENLELLQFLEKLALKQYETGKGTMVDVLRAQLNIRDAEYQLETLKLEYRPQQVAFNTKLNREIEKEVVLPEFMPLTYQDTTHLLDTILLRNSQIRRINALQQAARKQYDFAKLQGLPDFRVGVLFGNVKPVEGFRVVDNGQNIILPSIGITLPIYRKKYKALKQEARFRLADLNESKQELKNQLIREYEQAKKDLKDAILKINLYKKQIEQARQALNLLIRDFSTAGKDFEEILRMQRMILNYELELIRAQIQHNITIAEFERLISEKE